MKRFVPLLFLIIALWSCRNEQTIRITGEYPTGKGETVDLELFRMPSLVTLDSLKIRQNGKFSFSFDLEAPELVLLSDEKGRKINLLVHPGDNIHLEIRDSLFNVNYALRGSEDSEKIRTLVSSISETRRKLDSISDALSQYEDPDDPRVAVLVSTYQQEINSRKKQSIRFIVENISSLASVYALYQRIDPDQYLFSDFRDLQYLKIVADSVKNKYPESSMVRALVSEVLRREEQYRTMQAISQVQDGKVEVTGSIDLAIQDPENRVIRLSSLRGKVVLLNFWASRNAASIDANSNLKSIYREYHDRGFEVYSVSLDNNSVDWLSVVRFEEYPWIDVCELTYPQSYAASSYNVTSLPANYLIDRDGNIVARNLGGKALTTYLDNLL